MKRNALANMVLAIGTFSMAACESVTVQGVLATDPLIVGRSQQDPAAATKLISELGGIEIDGVYTDPLVSSDSAAGRVIFLKPNPDRLFPDKPLNCTIADVAAEESGWSHIEIRGKGIMGPKAKARSLWKAYCRRLDSLGLQHQLTLPPP